MIRFRRATAAAVTVFWRALCIAGIAGAGVLGGCDSGDGYTRVSGSTMGTYYAVTARCAAGDGVREAVTAQLLAVNSSMSTYDPESTLSRFNASPQGAWFAVEPELLRVVSAARQISELSAGAFDVTVGPLVNLWGFGPNAQLTGGPTDADVAAAEARVGYERLILRQTPPALRKEADLYVDLSAIAKGHGVDRVAEQLDALGCDAYLVDIGGEVRVKGTNPHERSWRIGVEVPDPEAIGAIQRILTLDNNAVATSGDYRNFLEIDDQRVSHMIDPRTGRPAVHQLASVTVVHESAMWADGFATALSVLGPEAGMALARRQQLAVMLVVRGASGFEEAYTPRMLDYLVTQ